MTTMRAPPKTRRWTWRSQEFRGVVYQLLSLLILAAAVAYLLHNTLENMRTRGIKSRVRLLQPAGRLYNRRKPGAFRFV